MKDRVLTLILECNLGAKKPNQENVPKLTAFLGRLTPITADPLEGGSDETRYCDR